MAAIICNSARRGRQTNESNMANRIDFYFDFSSPYGYFGASRIDALAHRHGREVDWHPLLLGVVFKTTGGMPLQPGCKSLIKKTGAAILY
jgi:2-hydroxychromene-2-carboxylate isomerase